MLAQKVAVKNEDAVPVFGLYRLALALLVVFTHTGARHHLSGGYAVYGFFALSGYLMTLAFRTHYQHKTHPNRDFWMNRFLRIYPVYWVSMLVAVAVVYSLDSITLKEEMVKPRDILDWIQNFIIIGPLPINPPGNHWRLLSVAWSLHIEIYFYLLAPFILAGGVRYYLFLLSAVAALVYSQYGGLNFGERYFTFYAALPAFALGSAMYHWHERIPPLKPVWVLLVAGFVFTLNCNPMLFFVYLQFNGLYAMLLLHSILILCLGRAGRKDSLFMAIDRYAGSITYPLFLIHIPVSELTRFVLPSALGPYHMGYFYFAAVFSLLAAAAIHEIVEKRLVPYRKRVRQTP